MPRLLIATLVVLGCLPAAAPAADPPGERQLLIRMRLVEGDPRGSVDEGTQRVLAAPALVTLEGREATVQVGGEVPLADDPGAPLVFAPVGVRAVLRPGQVDGDRVRLDVELSYSEAVEEREGRRAVRGETYRTVIDARLGKRQTLGGQGRVGGSLRWLELTVEEAHPNRDE